MNRNDTSTGLSLMFRRFGAYFLSLASLFWLFFPGSMGLASFFRWFSIPFMVVAFLAVFTISLLFNICSRNVKHVLRGFRLNKIYLFFITFYLIRDLVAIMGNYSYLMQNNEALLYTISCLFRLGLFCCLLYCINLLYMDFYNRKCLLKMCHLGSVFVSIWLLSLKILAPSNFQPYGFWFNVSYIIQTKPPMILFLLMILHFFFKEIKFKYFFIAVLGVFLCSFQGKRSGLFLGCASLFLFIYVFSYKRINVQRKGWYYGCIVLLLVLLFFKISTWESYLKKGHGCRIVLLEKSCSTFTHLDAFHKFFGTGDILEKVGYPHNVLLSLLLSTGIIGSMLWIWPFVYILCCFRKFKGKRFIDLCLWIPLIMYFLNSFATGFFLYHTPLYFLLYFMEYRYRHLENKLVLQ